MCGICGELRFGGAGEIGGELAAMRDLLVHRGPDSDGLYVSADRRAGLGFRRLRIIDLSANASQPIASEDGSVRLVFNGEIYNFRALRERLVASGHTFRSHSDSEVIVHLYEELGPDCIAALDGMFALAVWDDRRRRLWLARDRAGKKPLFYYRSDTLFAFASEMKAFFAHPEIPIEPDPEAVPSYFIYGYVPAPATVYRHVRQLEPGHMLTVAADGAVRDTCYWRLQYPREGAVRPIARAEAVAGVRDRLTRAVERRLVSDVPLGAFLSGGVDSTIVVGLMSRLMRERVKTFSIGFEGDPAYDETSYARLVAGRFGTDHTEFRVTPSSIDLVDTLIWHHDGPFGDSSAVPTYIVSRLTREQVTVVLTGDGGDELFAGYLRFYAAVLSERIPRAAGRAVHALLSRVAAPPNDRHWLARGQRFFRSMGTPLYERMTRWNALFYEDLDRLLRPDFAASLSPIDRLQYIAAALPAMDGRSTLGKVLHANFVSYLPDDLLVKTDRCTMANSLEARSPFLDRELVEYVAALPDAMKLRGRQTKVILREAFADLLPREVQRRGKMGFGVPLGTWFRGELRDYMRDLLLAPDARYRTMLSETFVRQLVSRHLSGEANHGHQLWSLMCFERWLQVLPSWTRARSSAIPPAATSAALSAPPR
ncbi:MAG: asparagine synthase (glutamine-hydrolyzing) [Acidobacteria bacterium]|nr:asparagine synthase (glutamine-hydrolyzing) [Acidobacteriota bacterium]